MFICENVCSYPYLSACHYICLFSVCLCPSVCFCFSVRPSVRASVRLPLCLSFVSLFESRFSSEAMGLFNRLRVSWTLWLFRGHHGLPKFLHLQLGSALQILLSFRHALEPSRVRLRLVQKREVQKVTDIH